MRQSTRLLGYVFTAFALLSLVIATMAAGLLLSERITRLGDRWEWASTWPDYSAGDIRFSTISLYCVGGLVQINSRKSNDTVDTLPVEPFGSFIHEIARDSEPMMRPADWGGSGYYFALASFEYESASKDHAADFFRFRQLCIPLWFVALLFAIPPAVWEWRYRVGLWRLFRARRGLCPVCGYDLRASSGRCPECGNAVASPLPPSQPSQLPIPAAKP